LKGLSQYSYCPLEKHYLNLTEVQSFIDKEGIKEFIFRKLWNEIVSEPPLRYLTKLKMQLQK